MSRFEFIVEIPGRWTWAAWSPGVQQRICFVRHAWSARGEKEIPGCRRAELPTCGSSLPSRPMRVPVAS